MSTTPIELTVVITTHHEGRLLRPTFRSIAAGIRALGGCDTEVLVVRDRADAATTRETDHWLTTGDLGAPIRVLDVDLGESGASRNAGAHAARGDVVAFIDGDDLISADYLVGALETLRRTSSDVILHPHHVVSFGARTMLWSTESTRAHDISYRDLLRHNPWPSSAITRRRVFLAHPYRSLPPGAGYGPEDWIWNIDTAAAGVVHDFVPDSVFFYRVRERGGVNNGHSASVLPHFDLDGLRRHLPPGEPSPFQERTGGPRALLARAYYLLRPAARRLTSWLSPDVRRFLYQSARWSARTVTGRSTRAPTAEPPSPHVLAALKAASEIEPAISWAAYRFAELPAWHARDDGYAEIIERALEALPSPGGAIVAVPWVGVGGADLVSVNYARALQASGRFRGRTAILGTFLEDRTRPDQLPTDVPYTHLHERWLSFPPHIRRRLIAQIIILSRPEVVISVNCFHFNDAMQVHAAQITDGTRAYSTLFAFDRIGEGFPVNPITDDSQRDHLDLMSGLITDNTTTAALIEDITALPPDRVLVHRQPADAPRTADRPSPAADDESFSDERPFRVLWPHRLDEEKRPETLAPIAEALRRRGVPAVLEVRGQRVLTGADDALFKAFKRAGVTYLGPYSGGLPGIDVSQYHALLLTSKSEGLPLVLVQALHMGLPVVASRVGGVPDIIVDGKTGLLNGAPNDVSGYVDAIERLVSDRELRRRLIAGGAAFAGAEHSWNAFRATVERSIVDPVGIAEDPARINL